MDARPRHPPQRCAPPEGRVSTPEVAARAESLRRVLTAAPEGDASRWEFSVWEDQPDEEPRIRDIDAAERLGFKRPRKIRELIERIWPESHRPVLRPAVGRRRVRGNGFQEYTVTEYWLTEAELLKVCARASTPIAEAILDEMIAVYMAVRRHLAGTVPVRAHERALPGPRTPPASSRAMELARWLASQTGSTPEAVLTAALDAWADASEGLPRAELRHPPRAPRALLVFVSEGTYEALGASILADGITPEPMHVAVIASDVLTGHSYMQRAFCGLGSRVRRGPNWLNPPRR